MNLEPGSYIWATRGREWGFRFLRDGGYTDPLPVYEAAFEGIAEQRSATRQVGNLLALRFPDPDGRQDHARRLISHDFVIRATSSTPLPSMTNAVRTAWESVADEYDRIWGAESPSSIPDATGL